MDTENFLTVREAAAALGVSESAVRNAMLEGRLSSAVALGKKVIARADLAAYQQRTQQGGVKPRGRPKKAIDLQEVGA